MQLELRTFSSLYPHLWRKSVFSIGLVSMAVIILTVAGQWYSTEQPAIIVPAARPDWGRLRVRFLSLIPTETNLTLQPGRKINRKILQNERNIKGHLIYPSLGISLLQYLQQVVTSLSLNSSKDGEFIKYQGSQFHFTSLNC